MEDEDLRDDEEAEKDKENENEEVESKGAAAHQSAEGKRGKISKKEKRRKMMLMVEEINKKVNLDEKKLRNK